MHMHEKASTVIQMQTYVVVELRRNIFLLHSRKQLCFHGDHSVFSMQLMAGTEVMGVASLTP